MEREKEQDGGGSELKNKSTFNRGVECGHMRGRGLMGDPSSAFTPGVPADQSGLTRVGVGQGPRGPGQASVSPVERTDWLRPR